MRTPKAVLQFAIATIGMLKCISHKQTLHYHAIVFRNGFGGLCSNHRRSKGAFATMIGTLLSPLATIY